MKQNINEACPICGDKVSGYHYGLLTCESCKGFFKRTVQNGKKFTCVHSNKCLINKLQRKFCQACRFEKCKRVGMKVEVVRRNRVRGGRNSLRNYYKRDRERKINLKIVNENQDFQSCIFYSQNTNWEKTEIDEIHENFEMKLSPPMPRTQFLPMTTTRHHNDIRINRMPEPFNMFNNAMHLTLLNEMTLEETDFTKPCGFWYNTQQIYAENLQENRESFAQSKILGKENCVRNIYVPTSIQLLMNSEFTQSEVKDKVITSLSRHHPNNSTQLDVCFIREVIEQSLHVLVQWAKKSAHFSDLQVPEQMRLLRSSWIELLLLDHIFRQTTSPSDMILLVTGHQLPRKMVMASNEEGILLGRIMKNSLEISKKFSSVDMDKHEFVCLKYLTLFLSETKQGSLSIQDKISEAFCEYEVRNYSDQPGRLGSMMMWLSKIRALAMQVDDYLKLLQQNHFIPSNLLLMEMIKFRQLHAE